MLERRGFLGAVLGAGMAPMLVGMTGGREDGRTTPLPSDFPSSHLPAEKWDLSWLDRLTGKHKQVFDFKDVELLLVVKNWYDAQEEVFGLKHPDVNAVVGIARRAFPVNATDQLYQKFPIGELWQVNDPETGKPALRNVFLEGGKVPPYIGAGVRPLQARGAIFWMCNNALQGVARQIGNAVKRPEPEVYQELRAALNPGVILVPAHTLLIGLCQERGCAYEVL